MAIHRAQVRLQGTSGLPEDIVTNTFYFDGGEAAPSTGGNIAAAISGFYSEIATYLSDTIASGNVHEIKFYDMGDAEPRQPYLTAPLSVEPGTTGANYPQEVSCCLSFRAITLSGQDPANRRGRLYIGPLKAATSTEDAGQVPRPSDTFRVALLEAADSMAEGLRENLDIVWSIWSPTTQLILPVSYAWVDNEFDTQRRRGRQATARSTLTIYEVPGLP